MIQYRQYVPEDKRDDVDFVARITVSVCENLARQVGANDEIDEYIYGLIRERVTRRESRNGGFWIHSWIDKSPEVDYMRSDFVAPFKVNVPFAKERDAVDMTPEQLEEHEQWKAHS